MTETEPLSAWKKSEIEEIAYNEADKHYRRYEQRIIELERKLADKRRYEQRIIELERKLWTAEKEIKYFIRNFKNVGNDVNTRWLEER